MATQVQIHIGPVLEQLKMEFVPDPSGRVGGDVAYEITSETIQLLQDAKSRDDRLILHSDGSIAFSQF